VRVRWNFERTVQQFAVHWAGAFLGVLLTALLLDPYVRLPETGSLMYWATAAAFSAVLAALNVYVRPLMYLATLPLTCCFMVATLGFGHFVVGAFMFWLAGQISGPNVPVLNIDVAPLIALLIILAGLLVLLQNYFTRPAGAVAFRGAGVEIAFPFRSALDLGQIYDFVEMVRVAQQSAEPEALGNVRPVG